MLNWKRQLRSTVFEPLAKFVYSGTEGKSNLESLRLSTLYVCVGAFATSAMALALLRLFQGRYLTASVDLLAAVATLSSLWMARKGMFDCAVWMLGIAPPVLAAILVYMGLFQESQMTPMIALCMVTSILLFKRLSFRIAYIFFCLAIMTAMNLIAEAQVLNLVIFVIHTLIFAFIFSWFIYFFERQDAKLHATLRENHKTNEALIERIEELLVFSRVMNHDLKGPLTAIRGHADLLEHHFDQPSTDKEAKESVMAISNAAESMNTLLSDLLTYARVSIADEKFHPVNLHDVVAEAEKLLAHQIKESGARVETAQLPEVMGNASLFRTVFYNLISNAIKYQPMGKPEHQPHIQIFASASATHWFVFVEDNGIGIHENFLPDLFTPFKRDRVASYAGSGLGMSICQSVMQKYDGAIEVASSKPGQTIFKLTFSNLGG